MPLSRFFAGRFVVPSTVNSKIPSQSEAGTDGNQDDSIFDPSCPTESSDSMDESFTISGGRGGEDNGGGGGQGIDDGKKCC